MNAPSSSLSSSGRLADRNHFTADQTKLIIARRLEMREQFNNPKPKGRYWALILKELTETFPDMPVKTQDQVTKRYSNMYHRYVQEKNKLEASGETTSDWEYWELLHLGLDVTIPAIPEISVPNIHNTNDKGIMTDIEEAQAVDLSGRAILFTHPAPVVMAKEPPEPLLSALLAAPAQTGPPRPPPQATAPVPVVPTTAPLSIPAPTRAGPSYAPITEERQEAAVLPSSRPKKNSNLDNAVTEPAMKKRREDRKTVLLEKAEKLRAASQMRMQKIAEILEQRRNREVEKEAKAAERHRQSMELGEQFLQKMSEITAVLQAHKQE